MHFNEMSAEDKLSIIEHLEALRKTMIISVVAIIVAAFGAFYFSEQLLAIIISQLQ